MELTSAMTFYVARWIAVNPPIREYFKMAESVDDLKKLYYKRLKQYVAHSDNFRKGARSVSWETLHKLVQNL